MYITDDGRAFTGSSQFTVAINANNQGVILRCLFDQVIGNQQAHVLVNGSLVGTWYRAGSNPDIHWREDDFLIPASFTSGKSSITITIQFASSDADWNEFRYSIYSEVPNGSALPAVPAPPGSSVAPTSNPRTWWMVDTSPAAPGYRDGWDQVGTLNAATNYVFCKAWGAEVSDNTGSNYNHYWLWTDLDTGGQGWISAYYLSNWGNDVAKDNSGNVIPDC